MRKPTLTVYVKDIEGKPKAKIVELSGVLDVLCPPALQREIPPLLKAGFDLIFDFTALIYMNSRGLVSFLDFSETAQKKGLKFIAVNSNKSIREVLNISGAIKLLVVCDTVEEAIGKLG